MRSLAVWSGVALLAVALGACSGDDDDDAAASGAGKGGSAAAGGPAVGGTPGVGGAAGRGTGGASGASGSGVTAGTSGATASGGAAQSGGAGKAGNGTGGGGRAGASGSAGSSTAGTMGEGGAAGETSNDGGNWVLGYWAVWQTEQYPLDKVKWSAMTHAAISFVLPRAPASPNAQSPYATLDTSQVADSLGATGMADFASAAHAGGTKALISLGGEGAGAGFTAASNATNRAQFVSEIVAACAEWGYDGVDLDWEDSINYPSFKALVADLRAAAPPGFVVTVPVGTVNNNIGLDADTSDLWSSSYQYVDQINVMTYVGSGAYPGWVVWYFCPLKGAGADHPFDVATTLTAWSELGIPKSKLGVGIGFYGRGVGAPVTEALQDYGNAEVYENDTTLSYGSIMGHFYDQGGAEYHFDENAMAPYLSWSSPFTPDWSDEFQGQQAPSVQFLTYEDEAGVAAKGAWAKQNGYGGAIIWTINEGVQYPYSANGYDNPLLDAVNDAFR